MTLETVADWRKRRLAELAKKVGGRKRLSEMAGHTDTSYLGQLIRGVRPITEKTISALMDALPQYRGWFDAPLGGFVDEHLDGFGPAPSSPAPSPKGTRSSDVGAAVDVIAGCLSVLSEDDLAIARKHLNTLTEAPDSQRVRLALVSALRSSGRGGNADKLPTAA